MAPKSSTAIVKTVDESVIRLITNPNISPIRGRFRSSRTGYLQVLQYLTKVRKGTGKNPYCPFVQSIEDHNGYHVMLIEQVPNLYELAMMVQSLQAEFWKLSPRQTTRKTDYAILVLAFENPNTFTKKFCDELEYCRRSFYLQFLKAGLMLGYMSPYHPRQSRKSKNSARFISPIPILVLRRLHPSDHVFLHTLEEQSIYSKYFGANQEPEDMSVMKSHSL
jgi:uncharacterized protein DUF6875